MNKIALISKSNIKPHLKQLIMNDIIKEKERKTFIWWGYEITIKKT